MNSIPKWPMAVLLCALAGQAQSADSDQAKAPLHAVKTNLPGVYAYPQPPADFNVETASQTELLAWGYPPRPSASEGADALARWSEAVDPRLKRVVPDLVVLPGVYHRPVQDLKLAATGSIVNGAVATTSNNWSGMSLVIGNGAQPFSSVSGRWIVPVVKQPPKTCSGGWDYSSQWVGIDGFNDQYLLQAGSSADVYCDIGNNVTEYYPWIEWLPAASMVLYANAANDSLEPFAAGDYLVVTVTATNFSGGVSTSGTLSYADVTQGWTTSLTYTAEALGGSQVVGGSAEWIVERPAVNGNLATLPDYVADPWYFAKAVDLGAVVHYPGAPGTSTAYNLTMLDINSADQSFVDTFGKDALWFFPEGSATK